MIGKETKIGVWCGHLSIEQGADDTSGTLRVRRVEGPNMPEHVQLDVTCARHYEKKTMTQSFCFTLTPAQVDALVVGLTKKRPPYEPADSLKRFSEQDAEDRAFYGLPERRAP